MRPKLSVQQFLALQRSDGTFCWATLRRLSNTTQQLERLRWFKDVVAQVSLEQEIDAKEAFDGERMAAEVAVRVAQRVFANGEQLRTRDVLAMLRAHPAIIAKRGASPTPTKRREQLRAALLNYMRTRDMHEWQRQKEEAELRKNIMDLLDLPEVDSSERAPSG